MLRDETTQLATATSHVPLAWFDGPRANTCTHLVEWEQSARKDLEKEHAIGVNIRFCRVFERGHDFRCRPSAAYARGMHISGTIQLKATGSQVLKHMLRSLPTTCEVRSLAAGRK